MYILCENLSYDYRMGIILQKIGRVENFNTLYILRNPEPHVTNLQQPIFKGHCLHGIGLRFNFLVFILLHI